MRMGKYSGITSMCAIPSESAGYIPVYKRPEVKEHVVIGTPGTIKKLMTGRKLKTGNIKILVFDEADHMLAEVIFVLIYLLNFHPCFLLMTCSLSYLVYHYHITTAFFFHCLYILVDIIP